MTFVKCVQSLELPVNDMTSEAEEPMQPADVYKNNLKNTQIYFFLD
jgi:hypothetical protein